MQHLLIIFLYITYYYFFTGKYVLNEFFNDSLLYEVLIYYTFVLVFSPVNACMTSAYVPIFKENIIFILFFMTCHSDLHLHTSHMVGSQSLLHALQPSCGQPVAVYTPGCVWVVKILMSLGQISYLLTITRLHEHLRRESKVAFHVTFLLCIILQESVHSLKFNLHL